MIIGRRTVLKGGLATAMGSALPSFGRAQTSSSDKEIFRVVKGTNLQVFDPIWTTANVTGDHGAMIYDTLLGLDAHFRPQPQMVGKWGLSDDKKTYTFELRDGLGWHDGTAVTAADCVASIRRWGQVDPGGQALMARAADISKKDDRTFTISVKEPFSLTIDVLAKLTTPCCFIMREKDANRPASEQVTANIGSGPFKFNHDLARPGASFTYDRNERYVPRHEPASGMAGGKVVYFNRVIWQIIDDPQTAMSALQAGEIDFQQRPPTDLIDQLIADPNITVDVLDKGGDDCYLRMNFLHKPFSELKARQAMLYLIDQKAYMKAAFGNPKFYGTVKSLFGNHTLMSNDDNTGWFDQAPNLEKARQLFKESGYNGELVVILQPTNMWTNVPSQYLAFQLRKIGVNADLAASDWGGVVSRRANRGPVEKGGWSIFMSLDSDYSHGDPLATSFLLANGPKAWYGWPQDKQYQALRTEWIDAGSLEERKGIARKMQHRWWDFVGAVLLGQVTQPTAYRKNVTGLIGIPEIIPLWNVRKV